VDWSALGTWAGAIATFLAVVVALRQIRAAQREIERQLTHQLALQSKSLLERHLLQALDTVHREPNSARSFFFDAQRFLTSTPSNINIPAAQGEVAAISRSVESAMNEFDRSVDVSVTVISALAASSDSAYQPFTKDLRDISEALKSVKQSAAQLRGWLADAANIRNTSPSEWDRLAQVQAVQAQADRGRTLIAGVIARLYSTNAG
jgi:hypothetical protein